MNQIFLMAVAILFLAKGGLGFVAAAWRMVVPMLLVGGAWYMIKKAMAPSSSIKGGRADDTQRFRERSDAPSANQVIEICPVCLSEVGSCPKCRKKKFF